MAIATSIEQSIVTQVEQWDGVSTVEKRDGATEFTYDGDDFGHVDDDGSVDLPLSSKLRAALVEAGRTEPHPVYKTSGWTTYWVNVEDDVEDAVKCLRLAYVYYVMKASQEEGKEHMAEGIDLERELDAFGADEQTREVMLGMQK
jgi:hypothetical protein